MSSLLQQSVELQLTPESVQCLYRHLSRGLCQHLWPVFLKRLRRELAQYLVLPTPGYAASEVLLVIQRECVFPVEHWELWEHAGGCRESGLGDVKRMHQRMRRVGKSDLETCSLC
jgi:hypothetical protein